MATQINVGGLVSVNPPGRLRVADPFGSVSHEIGDLPGWTDVAGSTDGRFLVFACQGDGREPTVTLFDVGTDRESTLEVCVEEAYGNGFPPSRCPPDLRVGVDGRSRRGPYPEMLWNANDSCLSGSVI